MRVRVGTREVRGDAGRRQLEPWQPKWRHPFFLRRATSNYVQTNEWLWLPFSWSDTKRKPNGCSKQFAHACPVLGPVQNSRLKLEALGAGANSHLRNYSAIAVNAAGFWALFESARQSI